jgi:antitoxin (DNA-binding transcriptional repressor) of toxin-antitoxin stability system
MKTLSAEEAGAALPAVLERVKNGEEIGIIGGNQIFQLKPIQAEPTIPPSPPGSSDAILQAIRDNPHLPSHAVDELEMAIKTAKLPVHASLILNEGT